MTSEPKRFHGAAKHWARKERPCSSWWLSRCVIRGDGKDELSVPCAMFERCMYAAQRQDYTPDELEVLDAWSRARVCLIGFSDPWTPDTSTLRIWEKL